MMSDWIRSKVSSGFVLAFVSTAPDLPVLFTQILFGLWETGEIQQYLLVIMVLLRVSVLHLSHR